MAPPGHPGRSLSSAANRLRGASVLLWTMQVVWLLVLGAGIAYSSAGPDAAYGASGAVDTGDAFMGFAMLLYLGLGAGTWALLAVWTCRTLGACRAAGNGAAERASWAWWSLFVPFAGLVMPLLAYREAAAYVLAASRVGGPGRGRGAWWRREPLPAMLTAWWSLWVAAAVFLFVATLVLTDAPSTAGGFFLLAAVLGSASSACGAVVLRRLAGVTAACASASWG